MKEVKKGEKAVDRAEQRNDPLVAGKMTGTGARDKRKIGDWRPETGRRSHAGPKEQESLSPGSVPTRAGDLLSLACR